MTVLVRCTVATAWPAWYSVASAWSAWIATRPMGHLVELCHLDGLPDSFEIDAYNACLVTWYTVGRAWYTVLTGWSAIARARGVTTTTTYESTALFFPQQNLTDLFEQRAIDGCSLAGLVTG